MVKFNKLFAGVLLACSCVVQGQVLDKVVATVNHDIITQHELDVYSKILVAELVEHSSGTMPDADTLRNQVLQRMILDKIQAQLAERTGVEVDSITVSQALQGIAQQRGLTLEQLQYSIERQGISFEEYRRIIRNDVLIHRLQSREVMQQVSVSKADIEAYLSSPAGQDQSGAEYRLGHILLTTPESPTPAVVERLQVEANAMVKALRGGADFRKIAMERSAGRQALHGGDLGWRSSGELPTLFINYVSSMQVGDIVGPIRSASGFHIIKLQEKRNSRQEMRTEMRVRHILIVPNERTSSSEAEVLLQTLRGQVMQGADFGKLAQKKSQDTRTATNGGELGWITSEQVLPKFYTVAANLANSEISEPFETDDGWHIVQVLERRNQLNSSDAARHKAFEVLTIRKTNEALENWTRRIRDEARVEILATKLSQNQPK